MTRIDTNVRMSKKLNDEIAKFKIHYREPTQEVIGRIFEEYKKLKNIKTKGGKQNGDKKSSLRMWYGTR